MDIDLFFISLTISVSVSIMLATDLYTIADIVFVDRHGISTGIDFRLRGDRGDGSRESRASQPLRDAQKITWTLFQTHGDRAVGRARRSHRTEE